MPVGIGVDVPVGIGVDVSVRRGLDIVVLDGGRRLLEAPLARQSSEDLEAVLRRVQPDVVAIDSPSAWGVRGTSRRAERELAALVAVIVAEGGPWFSLGEADEGCVVLPGVRPEAPYPRNG